MSGPKNVVYQVPLNRQTCGTCAKMVWADCAHVERDHRNDGNKPEPVNLRNKNFPGSCDPGQLVQEFQVILIRVWLPPGSDDH